MNPPTSSYALPQAFMASRFFQKPTPPTTTQTPNNEKEESNLEANSKPTVSNEDMKENLLPEELDKSMSDTNEFQEILDIIYDMRPINIAYGKDRRTQITPAILTGKNDLIYEHEIPSIIKKNSEEGFKEMQELNFKQAMIHFKKSENIINVSFFKTFFYMS